MMNREEKLRLVMLDDLAREIEQLRRKRMPDFPKQTTPKEVWEYATREITGDSANAVRDAVISDATRIPGADVHPIKTRTDSILAENAPLRGSKLMTGAEDMVVEVDRTAAPAVFHLEGAIDLTPMQAGDTIKIRELMMIKAAGVYVKYAEETYSGVQAIPLQELVTKPASYKLKVTIEQTAGVMRTFDYEFFERSI